MNPFKGSARYGATPQPETPYQRAGQAWDDRMGAARVQAANWRMATLGLLAANLALGGGLTWLATRGSVTPWVVEVSRDGGPRITAPAVQGARPTDPMIAWTLARFIADVRTNSTDPVVMRQGWLRAYDFVDTAGATVLSDHARRQDPFAQVGRAQVTVTVTSVVRATPSSFQVGWVEKRYADGQLAATERWTAILTLVIKPPRTAEALRANPLGIFVSAIAWSKEYGA